MPKKPEEKKEEQKDDKPKTSVWGKIKGVGGSIVDFFVGLSQFNS